MKPLSELLSQIDTDADRMALRQDLIKLKAIAVELAKGLECIMRDMPKKAKEKFDKNEVTYWRKEIDAEVLDHRFERAIVCRDVLTTARKILESE